MPETIKIEITIISATYLINLDIGKAQDPYVWFNFNGVDHQTTVKDEAGLAAEWNEKFNIQFNKGDKSDLHFMSFDKDMLSSDLIGKSDVIKLD